MIFSTRNYYFDYNPETSKLFIRETNVVSGAVATDLLTFKDPQNQPILGGMAGKVLLQVFTNDPNDDYRSLAMIEFPISYNWTPGQHEGWYIGNENVKNLYYDGEFLAEPFDLTSFSLYSDNDTDSPILQGYKHNPEELVVHATFEGIGLSL